MVMVLCVDGWMDGCIRILGRNRNREEGFMRRKKDKILGL